MSYTRHTNSNVPVMVSAPVSSPAAGAGSSHRDPAPSSGLGQPVTPDFTCLNQKERFVESILMAIIRIEGGGEGKVIFGAHAVRGGILIRVAVCASQSSRQCVERGAFTYSSREIYTRRTGGGEKGGPRWKALTAPASIKPVKQLPWLTMLSSSCPIASVNSSFTACRSSLLAAVAASSRPVSSAT